ncbi:MAG: hypothetical protein KKD44_06655 [Proteobacteria bacterium]|nr:hypothetical protein [Pseudomonadota bacterium]
MALYKETYQITGTFPGFENLKKKIDIITGLENELEILNDKSAVFSNNKFKTDIEATLNRDDSISLFFAPKRKKNYFEWSLIYALNDYLVIKNSRIPIYAQKKWKDLNIFEKLLK